MPKTKKCRTCGKRKSIDKFYKSPSYKDGKAPWCKECVLEYDRQRIANHPGQKITGTKVCSSCKKEQPTTEYTKRLRSKDGLRNRCVTCDRAAEKEYRKKHPKQRFINRLKHIYGLSWEQYLGMFDKQKNKCGICNKETRLVVDHCHKTNKVRGLLCPQCNTGLGMFFDNTTTLESAIDYLGKNK